MRAIPLFAILFLLAGCSASDLLAPSGAPAKIYTLRAPAQVTTSAPQAHWQLLVATPEVGLELDTSRIAVVPSSMRIDYYANVAWSDRPPAMLRDLLVESFDRSGRIGAVERQGGTLKSDFVLNSDLRDFQVETVGEPVAHIALTVRLVRSRDRAIVASRRFETKTPAGTSFEGAIAAFDQGLQTLLPQIVDWTLAEGARNQ
jgi:cholesterol transport system auxiliary component